MPQLYAVRPKQLATMLTRDRVRLDADVYYPAAAGEFPVLLMRQPYGRAIASTVVYAHPTWYAAQGFIVVIQDVRGRGTSAGDFRLFEHEAADGFDTVEWAAQLPQSNGRVGMYGFSYQGMTQLFAAQMCPPSLRAIAPAMVGYHPCTDWAYENGALLLQAGVGWAIQLAAETARLKGDRVAFQALYQASRQLPLTEAIPARPSVLEQYAPESFWHDWLAHPHPDDAYWQRLTPQLAAVDLPMLHIGGWFDPYLRGDLRLYRTLTARSQYPQPLWIGPWGHLPWGRVVGDRDFGPAANSPIDRLQVDWFSHWLQPDGGDRPTPDSTLHWFEMGSNRWRRFATWPEPPPQPWYLVSNGLAAMHLAAGRLVAAADLEESRDRPSPEAPPDTLVHDPWRPVPALGGHAAIPAGAFNRAALDCRSDVLTYTSAPLPAALAIAGQVEVVLTCRCDRPSFDLSVTLSEVSPDGAVYPLTQGYGRFGQIPDQWGSCRLLLQTTCFQLAAGQALRLSLSAACYPAYDLNPGTVQQPSAPSPLMAAQITTMQVQCLGDDATVLWLPVVPPAAIPQSE
ncbi:MAG TPA: CocE/NonD family hydrolase [Candidatus Obscuribacterales bacterium]